MSQSDKLKEVKKEAKMFFEGSPPSHDWAHVQRVYNLCLKIGKKEGADLEVLKLAALLHDIARKREDESKGKIDHATESARMAKGILKSYGYPEETISRVSHCIETHRSRDKRVPQTKEAKTLFDADKLDAIGAIGVARSFAFAGENRFKLYRDSNLDFSEKPLDKIDYDSHTPILEYTSKLGKIKDRMLTKTGRKIAEERNRFTKQFFERLEKEIRG